MLELQGLIVASFGYGIASHHLETGLTSLGIDPLRAPARSGRSASETNFNLCLAGNLTSLLFWVLQVCSRPGKQRQVPESRP